MIIAALIIGGLVVAGRRKKLDSAATAAKATPKAPLAPAAAPRHLHLVTATASRATPPVVAQPRDSVGATLPETVTVETGKNEKVDNLPNFITLAGYGLGAWWCAGGPAWAAIASIVMDEVDSRVARATGETTSFGGELDFTSDVALSAMALQRIGAPAWSIPLSTLASMTYRKQYGRPPIGSLRAAIMLYGVTRGAKKR